MGVLIKILLELIVFLFVKTKEIESHSVHQEIETTDGGGWFASGDYYLYTSKSEWIYFFRLPIWRLKHSVVKEFYCEEDTMVEQPITRKVIFEKTIFF